MARKLEDQDNVDPSDDDFLYGRIRDRDGGTPGTRVDEAVYGDIHQFFARLMALHGPVHNNLPDSDYVGFQLFEALTQFALNPTIVDIGVWDMDSTANVVITHNIADHLKIRSIDVIIINDSETSLVPLVTAGAVNSTSSATITLAREGGGAFDNTEYDDVSINRGHIKFNLVN